MSQVNNLVRFLKEVRSEGSRVQWPSGRQTVLTTGAVLVFVVITGLYLGFVDVLISFLMEAFLT